MSASAEVAVQKAPTTTFSLSDGSLHAIKWIALVLMVGDHIDATWLHRTSALLCGAGRLVFPLFGFVLAYNLARTDAVRRGVHGRVMKRLALYGLLASPAFWVIHGWMSLNILFTLFLFTFIVYCIEKNTQLHTALAWAAFGIGGALVEFWWFGLAYCLAAWVMCRSTSLPTVLLWIAGTAMLHLVNQSWWALAAIPVVLLFSKVNVQAPRVRTFFYAFYPAHLTALVLIGFLIGAQGK